MSNISQLGLAQSILLAVSLASDSNIQGLEALTTQRTDCFQLELILRIILSYLPESLDPTLYTSFLLHLATGEAATAARVFPIDTSPVGDVTDDAAQDKVRKLRLLKLQDCRDRRTLVQDPFVLFLIHRSQRIDVETGLLRLVPQLVSPFLERSAYLREWFISVVLPLLRLQHEYYAQPAEWTALRQFERLDGLDGVAALLARAVESSTSSESALDADELVSRDLRGVVGPWVYGSSHRKRRKTAATPSGDEQRDPTAAIDDWQNTFQWLVNTAATDFSVAANAIQHWDGPADVDLGGYDEALQADEDESVAELQYHLRSKYCQAAYAAIYAAELDTAAGLETVYRLLVRLADMCGFERPLASATRTDLLPQAERIAMPLEEIPKEFLQLDSFMRSDQPLTIPTPDSFLLLQQLVFTAQLLNSIGHQTSVAKVAKMRFWSDESEQVRLLHKIVNGLRHGESKTEQDYIRIRQALLWLWSWGVDDDGDDHGYGLLGKLSKADIEKEMLKALCSASQYQLAAKTYLPPTILNETEVEAAVVSTILQYYDNASNGNRSRGGMKKASDVLSTFRPALPASTLLRRLKSLISATHSVSFYALTLQQGVPLQPVAIRTHPDSIGLIERVLEQNVRAYTKLDDLIKIGRELVVALDHDPSFAEPAPTDSVKESARATVAERRIIGMAIEAALREEDFETAFSYVVNRLPSPQTRLASSSAADADQEDEDEDDMSWRAAFAAGRHRTTGNATGTPSVRRLEQRMELLSTALQLAPPPALPEILAAWRRCEEELLTVLAAEAAAEEDFDSRADRGIAGGELNVPGGFAAQEPTFMVQPRRKEIGRGAAEEAPMGLFDVARGAAQAFGRSANLGLGGSGRAQTRQPGNEGASQAGQMGEDGRQRKRDVVANAVTGGLVSGIGWVLGAKPVDTDP